MEKEIGRCRTLPTSREERLPAVNQFQETPGLQNRNPFVSMLYSSGTSNQVEIMKKTIAILALAALGITAANAGVHVGINFGIPVPVPVVAAPVPLVTTPAPVVVPPPMPAPIVEVATACPTPGYVWVGGNWVWCDNHWAWTRGHWGLPVHRGYAYHASHYESFHGGFHREHGRR